MKPLIIGIAGGSGSGKSTVARNVAQAIAAESVAFIDMDAYYNNYAHLPMDERRAINWDHPASFDWELLVRQFPGSPAVQVVRAYVWRDGKKYECDYWCDICAIPMYELKECECCQGPIRFRFRETGRACDGSIRHARTPPDPASRSRHSLRAGRGAQARRQASGASQSS